MAIGYRAGANAGNGGASVTIGVPAGTLNGDVMIAAIWRSGIAGNTPAGWTLLQTGIFNNAGDSVKVYRRVALNEPASYTFDGGTSTFTFGYIDSFSGVDTSAPEDAATPSSIDNATGATVTFPSITTVTAGAWHLAIIADFNNVNDVVTPSGYTARGFGPVNTKASETFSKAVGTPGVVSTTTTRTSGSWTTISVALRPGPASVTTPNSRIETALYAWLTANGPLQSLGAGGVVKIYEGRAPSAEANPYVIFQAMTPGTDVYVNSRRAYVETVYRVVAFASGPSKRPAQDMAETIDAALTDAPMPITGWSLMYLRREQVVEPPAEELGGVVWHQAGGLYRISVQQ